MQSIKKKKRESDKEKGITIALQVCYLLLEQQSARPGAHRGVKGSDCTTTKNSYSIQLS